jgi:MFS family permease
LAQSSVGYLDLLRRNQDFRRLWLAEVVSFFGDWFNTIALYAAVAELSSSTQAITAVFVAKMLPVFFMTPLAGPLIDRFDRRKLLIATDVARAVCAGGLVVAYRSQSLALLIAIVLVMVCFSGIFIPAKTAVLPQLTRVEELGAANALSAGSWSVMLAFGAAVGGVVTAAVGIELSLLLDGLTFLVSAALLWPLPALPPRADDDDGGAPSDRGFLAGLRYLWRHPLLAAIIALKPCMGLAAGGLAMIPVFATRVFGSGGPEAMGMLYAARGVGALCGSLLVRRLFGDTPRTMQRLIVPAFLVIAGAYWALAGAANLWQAALAYFFTAVGGGTLWVFSGTLGHLESDNAFRGRVFSIEWGALTLTISVAGGLSGSLVDRWGWSVREVARASGTVLLLPVALWLAVMLWQRRAAVAALTSSGERPRAGASGGPASPSASAPAEAEVEAEAEE